MVVSIKKRIVIDMENTTYEQLKARHAALLSLCKSGAKRATPVNSDRLKKAEDEHEFCAICAANEPSIAAIIKLYGLQDWFKDHAPLPPEGDTQSALDYLERCRALLRQEAARHTPEAMQDKARQAVLEYAAHFSGKLVHSSAQGAFLLARADVSTSQPHVFSRSLRAAGIDLPLDQSTLDNAGFYQRVLNILTKRGINPAWTLDAMREQAADDADEDEAADELGALDEHVEAIVLGAQQGLEQAFCRTPDFVDHRLRQVLLPNGNSYLAVSPLPSGSLAALWQSRAAVLNAQRERLASEFDGQPDANASGTQALLADEQAQAGRRSKKAEKKSVAPKKAPKMAPLFERLEMPFGGSIVRNTSVFPASVIQNQMAFHAPQRNQSIRDAWRFVYRAWRPRMTCADVEAVAAQIALMERSSALSKSTSVTATNIQSKGALGALARKCHEQAVSFAQELAEVSFVEDGEELPIDAALLQRKRGQAVGDLDLAIVNQEFDVNYRRAMAEVLVARLWSTLSRLGKSNALDDMRVRERVQNAIELALEAL